MLGDTDIDDIDTFVKSKDIFYSILCFGISGNVARSSRR